MTFIKCKWCNSDAVNGAQPDLEKELTRWLCTGCGAMGYIKDPTAEELVQIYKKAWKDSNNIGRFAAGSTSKRMASSLISVFCGSTVRGSCLEYGGGHGKFAEALLEHEVDDVFVFEPFGLRQNIVGISWLSSWGKLPLDKKFDWIFMVEVIEHLLDPLGELSRIRRRLTPGGKLAITTPNARGWRPIKEGTNWREAQNPTHINLFSPLALEKCLRRSGFNQVQRLYKPVCYDRKKLSNFGLAIMQMLGIDGGIRVVAHQDT